MRCTFYSSLIVSALFAAESTRQVRAVAMTSNDQEDFSKYDLAQVAAAENWLENDMGPEATLLPEEKFAQLEAASSSDSGSSSNSGSSDSKSGSSNSNSSSGSNADGLIPGVLIPLDSLSSCKSRTIISACL